MFSLSSARKDVEENDAISDKELIREYVTVDDLMEYGFIPEFIGRLPVIVTLKGLGKPELIRVLTEPKNAFIKQYKALFEMDGVSLSFSEEAISATAEKAVEQNTGARGLRSILENTLLDVMYELPNLEDINHCSVDESAINGESPVKMIIKDTDIEQNNPESNLKSA